MASTIVTKNSSTASAVPVTGDLTQGELAVNVTDKRLFTKNSGGTVVELGTNPSSLALSNGTANGVAYLNGSKVVTTGTALTFDGTNLGVGTSSTNLSGAGNGRFLTLLGTGATTTAASGRLELANPNTAATGNECGAILFEQVGNNSDVRIASISGTTTGSGGANGFGGYLAFATKGDNVAGAPTEGMRLTSTGLGIGTSSPSQKLDVQSPTSIIVSTSTTGTNSVRFVQNNTGGQLILGIDNSAGSSAFGVGAYAAGLWYTGAYPLVFATNNTERMRLDSSGNLGLGVTPSAWSSMTALQVKQAALVGYFNQNKLMANSYFNGSAYTYIASDYASELRQDGGKFIFLTAPSGTAGNAITFTQAMTLDSSGNLLVGTTSTINSAAFTVQKAVASNNVSVLDNSSATTPFGLQVRYSNAAPNGTSSEFYAAYDFPGPALRFSVRSNGGIANYSANNVNLSDRQEKTNFAPAKSYLDVICAIPVQTFNYIDQNLEEDDGLTLGVVAQDVQAVAPELVMESNWGTPEEPKMRLSIYQTDLQYALMKALQELKAEFDAYKATHP